MQANMKHNNICIIGIPEGEEEEQRIERLGINNDGKLPKFDERKSHANPGNTESPTSRNIIFKMAKFQDKERILKEAREKQE